MIGEYTKKEIMGIIGYIVLIILVIDLIGFLAWVFSGQTPVDGFYIGAITKNIISAVIN